jgi:hypothetical protein
VSFAHQVFFLPQDVLPSGEGVKVAKSVIPNAVIGDSVVLRDPASNEWYGTVIDIISEKGDEMLVVRPND